MALKYACKSDQKLKKGFSQELFLHFYSTNQSARC